jgi:hypothetical protein
MNSSLVCSDHPRRAPAIIAGHALALALILCPFQSFAGVLSGTVRDAQSKRPVSAARVLLFPDSLSRRTDALGAYRFDSLAPGSYTLDVRAEGYEPQTRAATYLAGEGTKTIDFSLTPRIVTLDKMVVRGTAFRKAPDMAASTKIMNFDEILREPGALVDIQRAVQNLPSVASGGDNVNEVVVRGGMPGENLLIMDNIEIPNPNHFANQGTGGGVVSLINPLLVQGLTFNAGAPPAQYGGKASSVIDVDLREGNTKLILGGLDMGMGGLGGHIEGPLWPDATFMFSAHRSYLDFIASFDPTAAIPRFWGMQGKLTQRLGAHTVYANGLYGRNSITIEQARDEGFDHDEVFSGGITYAGGLNWESWWGERFSTTVTASATGNTFDRATYSRSPADTGYFNASREEEQTVKVQGAWDLRDRDRFLGGAYVRRAAFDIRIREHPDTIVKDNGDTVRYAPAADRDEQGFQGGGYASYIMHAFDRLRLVPGVRADGFTYNNSATISPRLGAIFSLAPGLDLTGAGGIQYQQPAYADLAMNPRNRDLQPKRVLTAVAGIEHTLDARALKLVAEGFYKRYDNLALDSALLYGDRLDRSTMLVDTGIGHSYGLELFAQKKLTDRVFWTAAYAYSRSLLRDLRAGRAGQWYPSEYDFRHSLTLTAGYKLELLDRPWYARLHKRLWFRLLSPIMPIADRIELSAKWRYLGGRPYTKRQFSDRHDRWIAGHSLNSERYPAYHRLDVRYERRYGFGFLHLIYYFDIQNVYDRDNIWMYLYSDSQERTVAVTQLPFFPVGGIIIGF